MIVIIWQTDRRCTRPFDEPLDCARGLLRASELIRWAQQEL